MRPSTSQTGLKRRRGWALMDTLISIGFAAFMTSSMGVAMTDIERREISMTFATHINEISPIATRYLDANYQTLYSLIPLNTALEIPLYNRPNWQTIGDVASSSSSLPASWTPTLPYGQSLHFLVRHTTAQINNPEHLEGILVTSGGSAMSDRNAGLTALFLSGFGGSIMRRSYGAGPTAAIAGNINGLAASWTQSPMLWNSSGIPITYGHVAVYLSGNVQPLSTFLNRYNIGNPEANRMHASVDVNANDLNNIRSTDTEYIKNSRTDNIQVQNTLSGTNTLRLTGSALAINMHGGENLCIDNVSGCGLSIGEAGGIYDFGDQWVTVESSNPQNGLNVEGNLKADGYAEGAVLRAGGLVSANEPCASANNEYLTVVNGDISKDASGGVLSCVNGTWQPLTEFVQRKSYSWLWGAHNSSSSAWFVNAAAHTNGDDKGHYWTSMFLYVDGQNVCAQVGTGNDNASCSAMVPAGSSFSIGNNGYGFWSLTTTITGKGLP